MIITRKKLAALMLAPVTGLAAFLAPGLAAAASASPAPVAQVAGLHVTTATTTTLTVAWTAPADHNAKVRVQVYDADTLADTYDTAYKGGDIAGKTTVTATGLSAGTAYMLRADEYDGTANSGWTAPVTVYTAATGSTGTQGLPGPAGPSGVQAVAAETGSATLPAIGGSWTAGHAAVKDFTLAAGTYLVTLTGDFYKTATTTATPVLQIQLNGGSKQLTGYTGAFPYNAAEATGTGSDGTPNGLEQSAVAEGIITVPAGGASMEVDGFGYNPDRGGEGGGDFAVSATVGIVQLTPES